MPTIQQLKQNILEIDAIKTLAEIYTESSASKLQKIRHGIIRNRDFFENLAQIYHIVKISALSHGIALPQKSKGTALILLTSNSRFYGSVETKLMKFFLVENAHPKQSKADLFVIGKIGQNYLQSLHYSHAFTPITFTSDLPDTKEFNNLIAILNSYQQVFVYFAKLKSIAIQDPAVLDITENAVITSEVAQKDLVHQIFEPEINVILEFFETQMINLLLEQTFLEAELARTAARLMNMDQSKSNAEELLSEDNRTLNSIQKSQASARLLETIGPLFRSKDHLGIK